MGLNDVSERTHLGETCAEIITFLSPVGMAFLVGLMIGWVWKPKWACSWKDKKLVSSSVSESHHLLSPPSASSKSVASPSEGSSSAPCSSSLKLPLPVSESRALGSAEEKPPKPSNEYDDCSLLQPNKEQSSIVTKEDLEYLWQLVEMKDGGPPWIQMMDRSAPTMSYQAWRRDIKNGPPQYRSRTVFDDATPEIVRDFFWDDAFRPKWDDMLALSTTIEECATTGTMTVQWIRKFPFFCSDREYIIGRRIWKSGRSYYCVTKGVPYNSIPRRDKPRRVDLYYSSWCIRAVESRGNGQLTASEVMLFHYEDMGIPWEIAKLGVRQGMWGTVKKIEPGLRAYQKERASGAPLSRPALMAQINTKIDPEYLRALEVGEDVSENEVTVKSDEALCRNIPKLLIVGGAIVIACSLDQGFLPKALIFSIARRFANMGKKLKLEH